MSETSVAPRTRLITAFGTVVYFDEATLELRHGPVESCPENALFVADPSQPNAPARGWIIVQTGESWEPVARQSDQRLLSRIPHGTAATPTIMELVPLERGLLAFSAEGLFLSASPDGTIDLSASTCSTWELFLASEDWCTWASGLGSITAYSGDRRFVAKDVRTYMVHPLIRAAANLKPRRAKILIYGYPHWSHGRVYYDIAKHLYDRGYVVDILNWQIDHTGYMSQMLAHYDLVMSALDGIHLLLDMYGVDHKKIIALSHHEMDMRMLIERKGLEIFDQFGSYGVVSEYLYGASAMQGIRKLPRVASLGIDYGEFYTDVPRSLERVGYAGSMSVVTYGVEWKRGELAEAAARDAELTFRVAGSTANQTSFHDMPEFYRSVDAILITSINEGAGLPAMEAAAAGRLVIGTPVGHFPVKAYQGAGILGPIEAEKYRAFAAETLRFYKSNPSAFVDKCYAIQQAAKHFDWQYTITQWVDLIEAAM